MPVSKDERERAVLRSRRMYETDMISNLATAEYRGELRGERRGERKGKLAIAKNLMTMGFSSEQIVLATGLSLEEILRDSDSTP